MGYMQEDLELSTTNIIIQGMAETGSRIKLQEHSQALKSLECITM